MYASKKKPKMFNAMFVLWVAYICVDLFSSPADAQKIYWTDNSTGIVQRLNIDGSGMEEIISGHSANDIALDVSSGKIYWTDASIPKIRRSNIDGSDREDLVTENIQYPIGIALDLVAGKMYWTDRDTSKIQRANLDGTDMEDFIVLPDGEPFDIIVDHDLDMIFWTDRQNNNITRATLEGDHIHEMIAGGGNWPEGVAIDPEDKKIYWTITNEHKIMRSNLDGSKIEEIINRENLYRPKSISLDLYLKKIYWVDDATRLFRANFDGTSIEFINDSYIEQNKDVIGLAIDSVNGRVYWPTFSQITQLDTVGDNLKSAVVTGIHYPAGVSIDKASGIMYVAGKGAIYRAKLDGSNLTRLTEEWVWPQSLVVDTQSQSIYWADYHHDSSMVMRANLDGSNIEELVEVYGRAVGLAIDSVHEKMYWSNRFGGDMYRSNMDGSEVELLIQSGPGRILDIALDLQNEKIYWSIYYNVRIMRSDLDGSNIEEVVFVDTATVASGGLNEIEIDASAELIYWTSYDGIYRARLDGSNFETIVDGLFSPVGLALDTRRFSKIDIDIKPGSCPNAVNLNSRGTVTVAVMRYDSLDVNEIDIDSIRLARSDGLGFPIAPKTRRSHIMASVEDVSSPREREDCNCHVAEGDGQDDLVMKFSTVEMNESFDLDEFAANSEISLTLIGKFLDGTTFAADDCISIRGNQRRAQNLHSIRR